MPKFLVHGRMEFTFLNMEVEADSAEEAEEIAREMDYDRLMEASCEPDIEIDSADEVKPAVKKKGRGKK